MKDEADRCFVIHDENSGGTNPGRASGHRRQGFCLLRVLCRGQVERERRAFVDFRGYADCGRRVLLMMELDRRQTQPAAGLLG